MSAETLWVAYCTIVNKEVGRFLRIWMQTILPPAVSMTLYFIIFGSLIGEEFIQSMALALAEGQHGHSAHIIGSYGRALIGRRVGARCLKQCNFRSP